jgi:hypothetical protein
VPQESFRNILYQPVGSTLQDGPNTRSFNITTQMPMTVLAAASPDAQSLGLPQYDREISSNDFEEP